MGSRHSIRKALIGGVRDLTAADLADELRGFAPSPEPPENSPQSFPEESRISLSGFERLRVLHHRVAKVLAGFQGEVAPAAAVLGMDPGRIRSLKNNPAFVELVAFYRDRQDEILLDIRARMELLAHDSLAELHERLIGAPEQSPTNQELIALTRELLDRLGHAPVQKGVVAQVSLGADDMARLFSTAERVKVLEDVREVPQAPPAQRESRTDQLELTSSAGEPRVAQISASESGARGKDGKGQEDGEP